MTLFMDRRTFVSRLIAAGTVLSSRDVAAALTGTTSAYSVATSMAHLRSMPPSETPVYLSGYHYPFDGGGGLFHWRAGSNARDNGGTIIAIADNAPGRWESDADGTFNVKTFGATGDGSTNDNDAFRLASAALTNNGGGTLYIPKGTYVVDKQDDVRDRSQNYAYRPHSIIKIEKCIRPVKITSDNAILLRQSGLRYGAFDPETGEKIVLPDTKKPSRAYVAALGEMIRVSYCKSVEIFGPLELAGNLEKTEIGGWWAKDGKRHGTQLRGDGIVLDTVRDVVVENVHSHHHPLDGFYVTDDDAKSWTSTPSNVVLRNCVAEYNGRQGMSISGGHGMAFEDCRFDHTGRSKHRSPPSAGVDVEPKRQLLAQDLKFTNCTFIDNYKCGFLTWSQRMRDITLDNCTFQSSDSPTINAKFPGLRITNSRVLGGEISRTYSAVDFNDANRTVFQSTLFSDTPYPGRPVKPRFTKKLVSQNGTALTYIDCVFENPSYETTKRNDVFYHFYNHASLVKNCVFNQYSDVGKSNVAARKGLFRGVTLENAEFHEFLKNPKDQSYFYEVGNGVTLVGSNYIHGDHVRWGHHLSGQTGTLKQRAAEK